MRRFVAGAISLVVLVLLDVWFYLDRPPSDHHVRVVNSDDIVVRHPDGSDLVVLAIISTMVVR